MLHKETIEQKITVHRASIETLDFQIKSLASHVSSLQLAVWRKRRAKLAKELKGYQTKLKEYHGEAITSRKPKSIHN